MRWGGCHALNPGTSKRKFKVGCVYSILIRKQRRSKHVYGLTITITTSYGYDYGLKLKGWRHSWWCPLNWCIHHNWTVDHNSLLLRIAHPLGELMYDGLAFRTVLVFVAVFDTRLVSQSWIFDTLIKLWSTKSKTIAWEWINERTNESGGRVLSNKNSNHLL